MHQKPTQIIDVSDWRLDEQYSPYPEGTRDKDVYNSPNTAPYDFIVPDHKYLFKKSNKNFPWQFWAEIVAYRVGNLMGVEVPPAFVATNSAKQENASLIQWFYGPALSYPTVSYNKYSVGWVGQFARFVLSLISSDKETKISNGLRYVSGGNYMSRLIPDYDQKKGTQHNLKTLMLFSNYVAAASHSPDILLHWVGVFTFDAIIGNTDRHQDNWGVIWYGDMKPNLIAALSPAFDNGTSLGHEILEHNLYKYNEPPAIDKYINRGTHHIRWKISDKNKCGHFELIAKIARRYPETRDYMISLIQFDEEKIKDEIMSLTNFDVWDRLSPERANLMINFICARKRRLLKELGV